LPRGWLIVFGFDNQQLAIFWFKINPDFPFFFLTLQIEKRADRPGPKAGRRPVV
jgi:hypothetical protein